MVGRLGQRDLIDHGHRIGRGRHPDTLEAKPAEKVIRADAIGGESSAGSIHYQELTRMALS